MSGYFEFKLPIIGPIFEGVVLTYLKQNAAADFKMSTKALKSYIDRNGIPEIKK